MDVTNQEQEKLKKYKQILKNKEKRIDSYLINVFRFDKAEALQIKEFYLS